MASLPCAPGLAEVLPLHEHCLGGQGPCVWGHTFVTASTVLYHMVSNETAATEWKGVIWLAGTTVWGGGRGIVQKMLGRQGVEDHERGGTISAEP